MNLNDFTIINHKITFNNPYYANLENLLNNDFRTVEVVEQFLTELAYLNEHWEDMAIRETFIEIHLLDNDFYNVLSLIPLGQYNSESVM